MTLSLALSCLISLFADAPPGVVIDHITAEGRTYIGSPSLAALPSGDYVASHDFFGPGSTRDVTRVFRSTDKGKTWTKSAEFRGQWWSTLFFHRGALYLIGTSTEYGKAVIRRSTDGGTTWTVPKDGKTGVLFPQGTYHCAPVPVVIHQGRIWRAMEDADGPGGWGTRFRAFMMSAPVDADLLDASSWTSTNRIGRDPNWLGGKVGGWLEGNAVVTPEGGIVDILRVDLSDRPEKAAIVRISPDGKSATFDASKDFVEFPGGGKKFTIRWDEKSKAYWSLANHIPPDLKIGRAPSTRNTLALIRSTDLRSWEVVRIVLQHPDQKKHAFQYVDWLFEGDDIVFVSRTAFDDEKGGAHNAHDANFMTFHRLSDFRK